MSYPGQSDNPSGQQPGEGTPWPPHHDGPSWIDPTQPAQGFPPPTYSPPVYTPPIAPPYGAPVYPAPAYAGAVFPHGYVRKTNGMAIGSMITSIAGIVIPCTLVLSIVGMVLGFLARTQIRERDEEGDGMALAGIIVGAVGIAINIAVIVFWMWIVWWAHDVANDPYYHST